MKRKIKFADGLGSARAMNVANLFTAMLKDMIIDDDMTGCVPDAGGARELREG